VERELKKKAIQAKIMHTMRACHNNRAGVRELSKAIGLSRNCTLSHILEMQETQKIWASKVNYKVTQAYVVLINPSARAVFYEEYDEFQLVEIFDLYVGKHAFYKKTLEYYEGKKL